MYNQMNETIPLKGHITFTVRGQDGRIKEVREIKNLITNAGKAEAAGLLNGATTGPFSYIAVGTGTTAAAATDTTLVTELSTLGLARAQDTTVTRTTTTVTNDTAVVDVTYTVTGTAAVTESGLFDASSAGVMLSRQVFSAINVVSGDSLTVTWKIQCS